MDDNRKIQMIACSRRFILRKVAVATAGAALVGAGMSKPAEAKASQKLVSYRDMPHGKQECDNCSQFEPPSSCKAVAGAINPKGWCLVYSPKAAGQ